MKVYLSADIEGIAGIAHWDEANPDHPEYGALRERMTDHVVAACEGAVAAGAAEILVKDAHASARNILFDRLPPQARLVRGWSGHPFLMVEHLDESFDALVLVGWHARAGSGGNPLAHTLPSSKVARIEVNGAAVAEFHLYGWAAASVGVPIAFVSGDEALCAEVKAANPAIPVLPVLAGHGAGTVSLHPSVARDRIRRGVAAALADIGPDRLLPLPARFDAVVRFREAAAAYRGSFYPGAELEDDHSVRYSAATAMELLRPLGFLIR